MKQLIITPGLFLLLVIAVIVIVNIHARRAKGENGFKQTIRKSLFWLYLCVILSFTLFPICIPQDYPVDFEYNLNVLELLEGLFYRSTLILNAENALLFVPLTALAYNSGYTAFKKMKNSVLLAFGLSLGIELLQAVGMLTNVMTDACACDINDVITNTIGGLIGFILVNTYIKKIEAAKNSCSKPYSLHDSRIIEIRINDDILVLKMDRIFEYVGDEEKNYPGEIIFTKVDFDECAIKVFNSPYGNEGVKEFSGKTLSIQEFKDDYPNAEFEIVTETYHGYDTVYQGWVWRGEDDPLFAILSIWNMGDMNYKLH